MSNIHLKCTQILNLCTDVYVMFDAIVNTKLNCAATKPTTTRSMTAMRALLVIPHANTQAISCKYGVAANTVALFRTAKMESGPLDLQQSLMQQGIDIIYSLFCSLKCLCDMVFVRLFV